MIIKNFKDYLDSINEGLIKTYPGNVVLLDILQSLRKMHINVNGEFFMDRINLKINDFNLIPLNKIELLFDHILTFIVNRGGWFPSNMTIENISGMFTESKYDFYKIVKNHNDYKSISIYFESKFESIVDEIPEKLYHLTIKEYEKKINKSGLSPRSKSKLSSNIDRIYVCADLEDCKHLINKMLFYYTGEKDENIYIKGKKLYNKDITPIIYEIDNSDKFIGRLYNDINYYKYGYFIMDNIPPSKLKIAFKSK